MEEFKNRLLELEDKYEDLTYITKVGIVPVIITAAHTMLQQKENGEFKFAENFTKAIAMYVSENTNSFYLIKNKDTGIDPNHVENDTFKNMLLDQIKDNNIKLVIDLHGSKKERDFIIELGTLNNLSCDYSSLKELTEAFNENGIFNVEINDPFKGGMITQTIFSKTNCDVIQIEINGNYRNIEEPEKIKLICDSIIKFINQYTNIINK